MVLSSTWREGWHQEDESKNDISFIELRNKFNEFGIEIFDRTGEHRLDRWRAIKEYMERPREDPIEHYVIIDDWDDMGEYISHLVWTNPSTGLTDEDVEELRHLIDTGLTKESADLCDSGITLGGPAFLFLSFCLNLHGPELVHHERNAVSADSLLLVNDRSGARHLNRNSCDQHNR